MKKSLLLLSMVSGSVFAGGSPTLILEGVMDGPLPGGLPKVVEIYVSSVANGNNLIDCGLGVANNGGGSDGQEFTFASQTVVAGQHIYVSTETIEFTNWFGFAPDQTTGIVGINGDDPVELYCNTMVVDVYGDVALDGSGLAWDYLDGWAHRNSGTGPDGSTFVPGNWTYSGINVLDGETTNGTAATPYPNGTLPVELQNFSVE
jgi:hypothetical protein